MSNRLHPFSAAKFDAQLSSPEPLVSPPGPDQDGIPSRSQPLTRATIPLALLAFIVLAVILVCTKVWPSAFDELEHLSYAAYIQETGEFLPHIERMRTLVTTDLSRWNDRANYLGHPSPYYLYIAPFLDRGLAPGRAILPPRLASAALVALGVTLALLPAGRQFLRRDQPDPLALFIFCILVALCPKLLAVAGQVTNDALAFLAGGLGYWGAATFDRRQRVSLAAMALSILLALWAKPNAAIAVGAFLGLYALLRPSRLPVLVPALAVGGVIGLIPYAFILSRYGSVVPITVEQFGQVHQLASFGAYLPAFLVTVAYTWCFAQTGTWPMTSGAGYAAAALVWMLLGCAVLGAALARRLAPATAAIAVAAPLAFLLVFPVHFWFSANQLGFSLPAASFRYYLPIWPGLAHAIAIAITRTPHAWQRRSIAVVAILALVVGWISPGATD